MPVTGNAKRKRMIPVIFSKVKVRDVINVVASKRKDGVPVTGNLTIK